MLHRTETSQKIHQLNNLLGIIQGYADLLLLDARPGDEQAEMLQEIARASELATRVTASLSQSTTRKTA